MMIKKTFYNLPEEKRQRIIEAVMKEFSGSSADKVSINRIIKTADISRGSFYQYFDDKVDLVEILIGTFADMSIDRIYQALQSSNGDIFYTYIRLFDIITEFESALLRFLHRYLKIQYSTFLYRVRTAVKSERVIFVKLKLLNQAQ